MDFPLNLAIGGKSKETWRNAMYPILGPILFIKYISICLKSHVKYSIHQHISLSIWVVCVILWNENHSFVRSEIFAGYFHTTPLPPCSSGSCM